jgi:phosphoadenosine phosphosulfate reductase
MSELADKERRAIKVLRMYRGDDPIEVSYSGGKDSDVILALAKMAGIPYRAIYKNTTIDPPYTVQHCKENGVEVVMPKECFLDIIARKGFPTRRARFCCEVLKEYKILDNAVQGIRRSESTKRAKNYAENEPIICRNYSKSDHVNVYLPILDWSDKDVADFINAHGIKCHPLYYNEQGKFCVERRLGCIGCPLQSDNGVAHFVKYPKMLRQWIMAGKVWWNKERETPLASKAKFGDIYALMAHNLFFDDYDSFQAANTSMFGKADWKQRLEDYFKIEL